MFSKESLGVQNSGAQTFIRRSLERTINLQPYSLGMEKGTSSSLKPIAHHNLTFGSRTM